MWVRISDLLFYACCGAGFCFDSFKYSLLVCGKATMTRQQEPRQDSRYVQVGLHAGRERAWVWSRSVKEKSLQFALPEGSSQQIPSSRSSGEKKGRKKEK